MKHLKTKLLAAIAMLAVSAICLTSATFAWFTLSTNPEIKGVTTKVVTNENLEIALASGTTARGASAAGDSQDATASNDGSDYTWGNLVDLAHGTAKTNFDTFVTDGKTTIRPITLKSADKKFYAPKYGVDGRVIAVDKALDFDNANVNGFGTVVDTDGHVYAYFIDFWMRSNVGGQVTLGTAANRVAGDAATLGAGTTFTATGTTAADKVLAENISIAFATIGTFEVGGTTTYTPASAITPVAATRVAGTGAYDKKFEGNVVTLTANQDTLVRMYVYLEGENVTNAAASTDTVTLSGKFNLQFTIAAVDKPMNEVAPAPAGT